MSSNLIKVIAGVLVALAFILAFFAWRIGHDLNNGPVAASPAQSQAPVAPTVQVVVAKHPLLANLPIERGDVKLVSMDPEVAPVGYYANIDDVVGDGKSPGKTPKIDVDAGSPLTPRLWGEVDQVAKLVPPGHKAVSLVLTDVIGIGGFMRPGDVVDVLVFLRNDQSNKVDPAQARILLKDALVLASDDRVVNPPASNDKTPNAAQQQQQQQQQQQRHERTVVVAVPDEEVTRVMLGASLGEVRLALHGLAQEIQVASATTAEGATAPAAAAAPGTAAAPAGAPVAGTAPMPAEVSGASMAAAKPAAAAQPAANDQLPDMPYTSAELAKLKPKHGSGKGTPQGIVIYRGSKASTVYP